MSTAVKPSTRQIPRVRFVCGSGGSFFGRATPAEKSVKILDGEARGLTTVRDGVGMLWFYGVSVKFTSERNFLGANICVLYARV